MVSGGLFKSDAELLNVFRPLQAIHIYEVLWCYFDCLFCAGGRERMFAQF